MENRELEERFEFRNILETEVDQAARIEEVCFLPKEACSREQIRDRVEKAAELFLTVVDRKTGKIAGFISGVATDEEVFRDEFFADANLYNPDGKNIMLVGLAVLPEYRRQGLARKLMSQYFSREKERGRNMGILTCSKSKVKMYQKMGFCDRGISKSSWGGEEWHEMSRVIGDGLL